MADCLASTDISPLCNGKYIVIADMFVTDTRLGVGRGKELGAFVGVLVAYNTCEYECVLWNNPKVEFLSRNCG